MRITVYGATGEVGTRVVSEALSRGHRVTAVSRRGDLDVDRFDSAANLSVVAADVSHSADVIATATGQDLVISATRPRAGNEPALAVTTRTILAGLRDTGVRLIMVGGAASLRTDNGFTLAEQPDFPQHLRPIAMACNEQLAACRNDSIVDWTYVSPPALLFPGQRTGVFRVGFDDLLVDETGDSRISLEDFAVALVNEADNPRHRRTRFTVGY